MFKLMRSYAEQTMQQINVTEFGVRREELESMFQELIKKTMKQSSIYSRFLTLVFITRRGRAQGTPK